MARFSLEALALGLFFCRDAFGGALRFYLDITGLGLLWFLPDLLAVGCLAIFAYRRVYIDGNVIAGVLIAYVPFSLLIGYVFLENVSASLSSLKLILPIFVGFCFCQKHISDHKKVLFVIHMVLYLTIFGIILSDHATMPWIGYKFDTFGVERSSTKIWWSGGELRLSGFSADSTMAAFFVMISFVITSLRRSSVWCVAMGGVSLYAIDLTTNKTALGTLALYLVTLLLLRGLVDNAKITVLRKVASASFLCLLIPPILIVVLSGTDLSSFNPTLFSLQDRIDNSWQKPFVYMAEIMPTGFFSGCGLGCFNYPQEVFNARFEYFVPVDNFYIGTLLMIGPIFIVFMALVIQAMRWTDDPYKLTVVFVMNIFTVTVLSYGPASSLIMIAFSFSDVFAPPAPSRRPAVGRSVGPETALA